MYVPSVFYSRYDNSSIWSLLIQLLCFQFLLPSLLDTETILQVETLAQEHGFHALPPSCGLACPSSWLSERCRPWYFIPQASSYAQLIQGCSGDLQLKSRQRWAGSENISILPSVLSPPQDILCALSNSGELLILSTLPPLWPHPNSPSHKCSLMA